MASSPEPAAKGPRWQRLDYDERRSQILECARGLFTQQPYGAVSMAGIAACAGVRRGLLHHYFGSKHDLYLEVVRSFLAPFGDLLDDEAASDAGEHDGLAEADRAPIEQLIDTHVDSWLGIVEQQPDSWFAFIQAEDIGRDPEVRLVVERARSAMVEGIITSLGLTDAGDATRVVLRSYSGLADVVLREWLRLGSIDRHQAHALLATSLLAMVRDVAPAIEARSRPPRAKGRGRAASTRSR